MFNIMIITEHKQLFNCYVSSETLTELKKMGVKYKLLKKKIFN